MIDWIVPYTGQERLFPFFAQTMENQVDFLVPRSIEPFNLLIAIGIVLGIIFLAILIIYAIRKKIHFQHFLRQMESLRLNEEERGTFAYMVKSYSPQKPVRVLHSPQVFDEMASHEMLRILAGDESQGTKEKFVDTVYKIRTVTHFSKEDPEP